MYFALKSIKCFFPIAPHIIFSVTANFPTSTTGQIRMKVKAKIREIDFGLNQYLIRQMWNKLNRRY